MPPKALVRPAAAPRAVGRGIAAKARAVAKAVGKAKGAPAPKAGILRRKRPAAEGLDREEAKDLGETELSEIFKRGEEIEARLVPRGLWKTGQRVIVTRGIYWEEPVILAGLLVGILLEGEEITLKLEVEGSQAESLVKWAGLSPGRRLDLHLCGKDCPKMSQDGLVHGLRVKLLLPLGKEDWMDNLMDVRRDPGAEADELRRLREVAEKKKAGADLPGATPGGVGVGEESSSSSKAKKAKKKKSKKKKKDQKEKVKASGGKPLDQVFGNTAMDPKPEKRKAIKKRARRAAKKKGKREGSSTTSSRGSSHGSDSSSEEGGRLFGEEARVKMLWKRYPGALTLNTLEHVQTSLVTQSGQPWELDRSHLPPLFSQFWRMSLMTKMSGAMGRETQTLCYVQDLLIQGRIASACDVITQRLKGLEQISSGGHYSVAQRQELVPIETGTMSTPMESLEASRLQREEQKARAASARGWERRTDWDRRPEDAKGKGKSKDSKGKGKTKNEGAGQAKEDREKGRKGS